VAIELVKVVKNAPSEHYKNAFLNLALPLFVFSEPAPAVKTRMRFYVPKCCFYSRRVKLSVMITADDSFIHVLLHVSEL